MVIESWKDAPSIAELYDQACSSKGQQAFQNIKSLLNESESSNELCFRSILNEQSVSNAHSLQLEMIFESIKLNAKQNMGLSASATSTSAGPYLKALTKVDLSSNMLTDKELSQFMDTIGGECLTLKHLDLSFNLFTSSGLKTWIDQATHTLNRLNSSKSGYHCYYMENLNLSGNPLGPSVISSTSLNLFVGHLISLLQLYPSMRTLSLANCKINLEKLRKLNNDDNSIKRLFNSIKSKQS